MGYPSLLYIEVVPGPLLSDPKPQQDLWFYMTLYRVKVPCPLQNPVRDKISGLSLRFQFAGLIQQIGRESNSYRLILVLFKFCFHFPMKVTRDHAHSNRGKSLAPWLLITALKFSVKQQQSIYFVLCPKENLSHNPTSKSSTTTHPIPRLLHAPHQQNSTEQ